MKTTLTCHSDTNTESCNYYENIMDNVLLCLKLNELQYSVTCNTKVNGFTVLATNFYKRVKKEFRNIS